VTDLTCVTKTTLCHAGQEAHVSNYLPWSSEVQLKQTSLSYNFFQAPAKLEEKQLFQIYFFPAD